MHCMQGGIHRGLSLFGPAARECEVQQLRNCRLDFQNKCAAQPQAPCACCLLQQQPQLSTSFQPLPSPSRPLLHTATRHTKSTDGAPCTQTPRLVASSLKDLSLTKMVPSYGTTRLRAERTVRRLLRFKQLQPNSSTEQVGFGSLRSPTQTKAVPQYQPISPSTTKRCSGLTLSSSTAGPLILTECYTITAQHDHRPGPPSFLFAFAKHLLVSECAAFVVE